MATGPTLVSEKLDQAAEMPRRRNVDLSPTLVRETLRSDPVNVWSGG
jgi:hypothetical protein